MFLSVEILRRNGRGQAGLSLPAQALGGESMRPLLLAAAQQDDDAPLVRKKTWALSQWPRRPSCTVGGCEDGHGNPYEYLPDQAVMGYKLRTESWAYIVWLQFDWGDGADPQGVASKPYYDRIVAQELYDHVGDVGDSHSGEIYEWENLAYNQTYAATVTQLHKQVLATIVRGVVKPMTPPIYPL
jgi:hypothetical protein